MSKHRPPLWGNFIHHADEDFLAFGQLARGGLIIQALYHGVQAIEKYLKALAISVIDPNGISITPLTSPWLKTHNLCKLAKECGKKHSFYLEVENLKLFERLMEFDQATRYPWVERVHGNGFTSEDIGVIGNLIKMLRNDIPITIDDYKLGMEVRGHYHKHKTPDPTWRFYSHEPVESLRSIFPDINGFVRW